MRRRTLNSLLSSTITSLEHCLAEQGGDIFFAKGVIMYLLKGLIERSLLTENQRAQLSTIVILFEQCKKC